MRDDLPDGGAADEQAGRGGDDASLGPAEYARTCVAAFVRGGPAPEPPAAPVFLRRVACFVSLKKHGELRGCIGTLEPVEPDLSHEIQRNAYAAAFQDPRFPPVGEDELADLNCSVDVLSPSEPCSVADLDPQLYGVIVSTGWRRGVLLPALDGVRDVPTQVSIALQKGGIAPHEVFDVQRFTVERYREGDGPGWDDAPGRADEADA